MLLKRCISAATTYKLRRCRFSTVHAIMLIWVLATLCILSICTVFCQTAKANEAESLVSIAESQVGNGADYGLDEGWCQRFVNWCAKEAGLADAFPETDYCPVAIGWYKQQGQWYEAGDYIPVPGDIAYINYPKREQTGIANHVGIVTSFVEGRVHTVEGNYGDPGEVVTDGGCSDGYYYDGESDWTCEDDCYIVGYAHPYYAEIARSPVLAVDMAEAQEDIIYVRGWTYDPDSLNESLTVHVYVGGPDLSTGKCIEVHANKSSVDVCNAKSITGRHRFEALISANTYGEVPIIIYAINVDKGETTSWAGDLFIEDASSKPPAITSFHEHQLNQLVHGSCQQSAERFVKQPIR